MERNIVLGIIVALFFAIPPAWTGQGTPETPHSVSQAVPVSADVVDVGNQFCPLSGDKANPKFSYVYNGKRYSFCCRKCIKDFKKNPDQYLSKRVEQEPAA